MSFIGRHLCALARRTTVSELSSVSSRVFAKKVFVWLEGAAGRYPAAKKIYEVGVKPAMLTQRVNDAKTKDGSPALFYAGAPVLDAFQAIGTVQMILEEQADRNVKGTEWSFAAQSTQNAVVHAVLNGLFGKAVGVRRPTVVAVMMGPPSPLLPLRWVLGSTPGGSLGSRPALIAARRNLMEGRLGRLFEAKALGRCAESLPSILLAAWLVSGGRLGSFSLELEVLFEPDDATGLPK
ncbi:hypothetical protein B0H16DRAFT_1686697 [Mycena metata]|uniref:Uncharacterized protein n=1 Tax=Mycena metata TaxID=1033252 RepID=A0AAD7JPD2_9AGAR|nr:hypothetical protein B0H16DRAFT_1686697 [Mycena metata]